MAININLLSINVDGVDTPFEYADMLAELADKVDAFRQNFRGILTPEQRNQLRDFAESLRDKAVEVATKLAIEWLIELEKELEQLKQVVSEIDQLLNDIANTRLIISGLANILGLIANILAFVA